MLNGLALRIENGALGHDPDMSFHRESITGEKPDEVMVETHRPRKERSLGPGGGFSSKALARRGRGICCVSMQNGPKNGTDGKE